MADLFGDLGGAVGDIFGAMGDQAEGKAYETAAKLSTQNAAYEAESTAIKMTQAQRQITQTIGAQKAQVGGAGLAESGSAVDLLRSSQQQGNLQMQVMHTQGLIDENAYKEQAAANQGMADKANAASAGGFLSGILKVAGAVAPFI